MANVAHKDFAVVTLALDDKVLISDTSAAGATKNVINVPALTAAQVTALATGVPGLTSAGVVSNLAGTTVATLTSTAATLPGSVAIGAGGAVVNSAAANILQLRNSTAAQAFQVYNTYTDASNGEWGAMQFSSNVLQIGAFANGTGVQRAISVIGQNGVTLIGSTFGGSISQTSGGTINLLSSNGVTLALDGNLTLFSGLFRMHGITSSFPAIKRNGAAINFRLADDSADAAITASNVTTSGFVAGVEVTAPAAPATNGYRLYAEDNGSGKTRLMVLFATGAAQQVAIEP